MIATARALAEMLGAQLSAVHVRGDGDRTARSAADAAAVPLQIVPPDASVPETFRRVLVPLEGAPSTAPTPASIFELSGASTRQ